MSDPRSLLERESRRFIQPDGAFERLRRRRDRKRRNQRIAAGIVGIAVFVAAVWIVTSGRSFDRSTPVAPGGSETVPTQTAPPAAPASAAPEVVRRGRCSDGARSRLELEIVAPVLGRIGAWFVLHRSPVGHEWRIELRHYENTSLPSYSVVDRTRVASDSGDLRVYRSARDSTGPDGFVAKALDTQTGERCRVYAEIG
jgi:hypothetical protein